MELNHCVLLVALLKKKGGGTHSQHTVFPVLALQKESKFISYISEQNESLENVYLI